MKKSVAELRTEARDAYDKALLDPNADWQSIAERLLSVMPKTKKTAAKKSNEYADYVTPRKLTRSQPHDIEVTFADGETVKVTIYSDTQKHTNWGPALRGAASYYRYRMAARYYDHTNRRRKHMRGLYIYDLAQSIVAPAVVSAVNLDTKISLDMSTVPATPKPETLKKVSKSKAPKKTRNLNKLFGMGTWQTVEAMKPKTRKSKKELKAA